MNILVTGAGSLIGHGVLRSIQQMDSKSLKIFTADPDHRSAGHWLGNVGLRIPLAKDPEYITELIKLVDENQINVVFIGTDPELLKISKALEQIKATVVVSNPSVIRIGDDKWETVKFLKENGFAFPDSALMENPVEVKELISRCGFPLIAKPRVGARSTGVVKLENESDLNLIKGREDYIIQEYLPEAEGEFTAGTLTYDGVCYSQVIFRRDLKDGNTYRAYLYRNEVHEAYLKKVSIALTGTYGPLNFQYRIKNGLPVIFEINSRFSGTTPLRAAVGINEVEMALEYIDKGQIEKRSLMNQEVAIFRTWSDIIVPMEQVDEFVKTDHLINPKAKYFPFIRE